MARPKLYPNRFLITLPDREFTLLCNEAYNERKSNSEKGREIIKQYYKDKRLEDINDS